MNRDQQIRILAISGSLRRASFSTGLVHRLAQHAAHLMEITLHDISDIPLFNEDVEKAGKPAGVRRLIEAITGSHGVLIVTPEYNHGVPGVLKNALDWASQPFQQSAFRHKPVGLISSSLAATGGVRAQYQLRETLHSMLAMVVPGPEMIIGGIHTKLAGEEFVDAKSLDLILRGLESLRTHIVMGELQAELAAGQSAAFSKANPKPKDHLSVLACRK
jgi:chromate reductase, NAD(P)H dehydrogenase (quinone)